MKACPKCGAINDDNARYCDTCGSNMSAEVQENAVQPVNDQCGPKGGRNTMCIIGFWLTMGFIFASVLRVIVFFSFIAGVESQGEDVSTGLYLSMYLLVFLRIGLFIGGLVCSIIGNSQVKRRKQEGRNLALTGIYSSLGMAFVNILFIPMVIVVVGFSIFSNYSGSDSHSYSYDYPDYTTTSWYETTEYTDYYDEPTETEKRTMTFGTGPEMINLWSFTDEIPKMVGQYIKQNPEFGEKYTVECTIIATDGGAYQTALDNALVAGGDTAPDMYAAEAAFILKYSQGDMADFAAPYKDLGINADAKIKEADIAKYSVEIGTRNGQVVALGYQATGCAMIYNAEIAKDVFGTDDPEEIEKIVGAGSGNWDKFFEAAEKLKEKGYAAVSGPSDLWNACEKSADKAWIVDGQLTIDPKREKYLDIAKTLKDNGWSNDTNSWSEGWYTDMKGEGAQKVFAYFGPAWLINYVMIGQSGGNKIGEGTYGQWRVCAPPVGFFWGGTWILANKDTDNKEGVAELIEWITLDPSETGLQYLWANGLVDWDNDPSTPTAKDTVASAVVMAKSDGTLDFCGGQNIFPAFIAGNKYASAKAMTQYDETINGYFTDAAVQYAEGNVSREEAIENFKTNVQDNLSF